MASSYDKERLKLCASEDKNKGMSHYVSHSSQHQTFVLTDFLEQDDLALLEEKPIVAEKDDKFRNFLRCQAG